MATQPIDDENEEDQDIQLTDEPDQDEGVRDEQPSEDEYVIEAEGFDSDEQDTPTIRHMREELKRAKAEAAELRRSVQPKRVEVGEKPTLESCEWDGERFEREIDAYNDRKRQAEQQQNSEREQQEAVQRESERVRSNYRTSAAQLPVKDFSDAEKAFDESVPEVVRLGLYKYDAENAAKIVYAMGKRPGLLAQITAETDPIAQLVAAVKFGGKVNVVKRSSAPPPEKLLSGTAPVSQKSNDKKLAELEKEADKTGDRTKLIQFKKQRKETNNGR